MTEKDQREAKDIYRVTNETAAADMRNRAILVLAEMKRGIGAWDEATLVEAMERWSGWSGWSGCRSWRNADE